MERFGGYTRETLLAESEDLLCEVNIADYGRGEVA